MSTNDNDDFKPQSVRGSADLGYGEDSGIDAAKEDREAAISESKGTIPKCTPISLCHPSSADSLTCSAEVEELSQNDVLKNRTRGVRADAYKQERDIDTAIEQADEEF